jgi:response regulator RpfG family c-di-GMP phosphodiesterase
VVARSEIERGSGRLFDPAVVQAFLATPASEWVGVREELGASHALLEVA